MAYAFLSPGDPRFASFVPPGAEPPPTIPGTTLTPDQTGTLTSQLGSLVQSIVDAFSPPKPTGTAPEPDHTQRNVAIALVALAGGVYLWRRSKK